MSLREFSFPLDVYGALLEWTQGRLDYLHFGLFEHAGEPVAQAQERASARLWAQLPPAPCRVLEVGIGVGTTLARLRERGYDALGLTPEPAQAAYAQARHGAALPVATTRLEDLPAADAPWDLMLLQESAQYIAPLDLFEAADRLLDPGQATMVVMDEFALRRDSEADFGLHLLPHFVDIARRFGWRVVHDEDVSAQAALTLDVLAPLLATHRQRLLDELGVGTAALDALAASTARYRDNYRRGVYGYRLLRLQRGARPALRPMALGPAPAAAVRALFERVFGRAMGDAEWDWKYGDGRGGGVAMMRRDGSAAAFYGALARPLALFGQPALGCQICDVMVDTHAHETLVRQGAMYRAAATFIETEVGFGRRYIGGFGFPTDRALGVAERLRLYERADEMVQLSWPAAAGGPGWRWRVAPVDFAGVVPGTDLARELDGLWRQMAEALKASALGVRDAAWLHYRYGCKPGQAYEALLLRRWPGGRAAGLVVLRRHSDHLELMDVVCDPAVAPRLVAAARAWAARDPAVVRVRAWITRSHAALLQVSGDGATQETLDLHVPANAHTRGVPAQALVGRWFLMAGDTDFR